MDDGERDAIRNYLKRDSKFRNGAGVVATVAMFAAILLTAFVTQPWPRRGAGGGYGTNLGGPLLSGAAGFVAFLLSFWLMRRREPLHPPVLPKSVPDDKPS